MHDLDRTQLEAADTGEFEFESGDDEFEFDGEFESPIEGEAIVDEMDEMELATQFLEIQDEAELDEFLGKLIKRVGSAARRFVRSPIGRQVGGILKGAAKRVLPLAGRAVGGAFGGPVGAAIGGKLASGAGRLLGLELEGLSVEDQEFEVARQFVRFATEAVQKAAATPPSQPPQQAARTAVAAAARRHAPGLMRPGARVTARGRTSGRWVRRGNRIVLLGV